MRGRTPPAGAGRVGAPSRRSWLAVAVGVLLALPSIWWAAGTLLAPAATPTTGPALSGIGPSATGSGADPDVAEGAELTAGDDDVGDLPATPPLARLGDLAVHLPAAQPLVVGYHEASAVTAFDVAPVGQLDEDRNTTRTALPADNAEGTRYLVLSSRGRAAGPTSAIDVVLPEGETVHASVTGTVVDVRSYHLYGAHRDVRIEIVPEARPDVRLVAIHLDGPLVAVGDEVVGGVTPIAKTARSFPFSSHIDRETEPERHPHVHLEFQPVDLPRQGDDEDVTDEDDVVDGEEPG